MRNTSNGFASRQINDPDRIARENPQNYMLSTLWQYYNILVERGDSYYRMETTESLRQAKMYYLAADQQFLDEAGNAMDKVLLESWDDPSVSMAANPGTEGSPFLPPINQEIEDAYLELREKLGNIRNWRNIDGKPLNIPLIQPPIDPKQLQTAALAQSGNTSSSGPSEKEQQGLPFLTIYTHAHNAVTSLIRAAKLLKEGMMAHDGQTISNMHTDLEKYLADKFEISGQESLIESMKMRLKELRHDENEASTYDAWYSRLAGEFVNVGEGIGLECRIRATGIRSALQLANPIKNGIAAVLPNIFGLAVGGFEPEAIAQGTEDILQYTADKLDIGAEHNITLGGFERRRDENIMESSAGSHALKSIQSAIETLEYDIEQEEGTLKVLNKKLELKQAMVDFQRERSTNVEFHRWYVGKLSSLHRASFDLCVRYCRLAEKVFNTEGPSATNQVFIKPSWNDTKNGLFSGQALLLDLQRMNLAYLERIDGASRSKYTFSLRTMDERAFSILQYSGRAMFEIKDTYANAFYHGERNRRISSINVRLNGVQRANEEIRG